MTKKILLIAYCELLISVSAFAQPLVNSDQTVTFTLPDSGYRHVALKGSIDKDYKMTLSGGIWSVTTSPQQPEMYTYYFKADGKRLLDPSNPQKVRDVSKIFNYFIIDKGIAHDYTTHDVLHGRLDTIWYPSTLNGMSQRRMIVYVPAAYDTSPNARYPVLYLLHGSGGDETSWCDDGRAMQIFDNLIAEGRVCPIVVVMPNGNVNLDAAPGESPYMNKAASANNTGSWFGKFEKSFVPEILNYVESHYRIISDKEHRAIAGLSMGGFHSMYISMNNPDLFDYVGLFSPMSTNGMDDNRIGKLRKFSHNVQRLKVIGNMIGDNVPENTALEDKIQNIDVYEHLNDKLKQQFQNPPKLYYISIGNKDFLLHFAKKYMTNMDSLGCKYEYHLTDGAHSWENWRKYLVEFLGKIFR